MKTVVVNFLKKKKQKYRFSNNETRHVKAGNWMTTAVPVRQIEALVDIPKHNVKKGDLGGWIQSEENLSQDGGCWIESGMVYGTSVVSGDVYISKSLVDNSNIQDDVWVVESNIRSSTISGKGIIKDSTVENTIVNAFDKEKDLEEIEQKYGRALDTSINKSHIYHSKLTGNILTKNSTVYLGELSGVKTDSDSYSLVIKNSRFDIDEEKVTDMSEFILLLSNDKEDLRLEDVEMKMSPGEAGWGVVIHADGYVEHIRTEKLDVMGLYGRLDVQNIFLKDSSLTLNNFIDSKSIIKGQDTLNPIVFEDAYVELNNTELIGSVYLNGAFNANFLKMDGLSRLIVSGGMPELHTISILEVAELNLVSNYEYKNIHIRGDEILNR